MPSIAQTWAAERREKQNRAQDARKAVDAGRPQVKSHKSFDILALVNDDGTVTTWQRDLDATDALAVAQFLIHVYADHDLSVVPPPKVTS